MIVAEIITHLNMDSWLRRTIDDHTYSIYERVSDDAVSVCRYFMDEMVLSAVIMLSYMPAYLYLSNYGAHTWEVIDAVDDAPDTIILRSDVE